MDTMESFLTSHALPLPSQADPMLTSSSTLFLSTSDGAGRFEVPSEAASRCSALIKSLLEDADGDTTGGAVVFPISIDAAVMPAVSMVASWLRSSSALEPPVSATIPVHDVSQNPGTTGQRGSKIVAAAVQDQWARNVLDKVYPLMMDTIVVPRRDATPSIGRGVAAARAPVTEGNTAVATLEVCIGIRGLALLYAVTQLAGFLGLTRLSELCSAYVLHGLQEAIRDERAFGVSDRRRAASAATEERVEGASGQPSTHFAVDVVRRSLESRPAQWGASIPLMPALTVPTDDVGQADDPRNMVAWLRETCTGMHLGAS